MEKKIKDVNLFKMDTGNTKESVTQSESESVTVNSFKIKRKRVSDYTIPMTYRLKSKTIEKIRDKAQIAGMGVSEYLQTVLDLVLDEIEIE